MIWEIALGIVFGVLLLIALFVFVACVYVIISKFSTLRNTTIKRYDFEEDDDDEFDEYK